MPYRPAFADCAWPPPGPIPRRMPGGRILVRRTKLTEDGPVPAGNGCSRRARTASRRETSSTGATGHRAAPREPTPPYDFHG